MELDMIVVLGLAALFFGAIIYLVVKERAGNATRAADIPLASQEDNEPVIRRKKRKS